MGIRQMAATGEHGEDEGALRRVRASHITRENLRAAIARVVNETLAAREVEWWGEATTTASDSKRFGSWESNLMTEFHARYGTGVRTGSFDPISVVFLHLSSSAGHWRAD